MPGRLSYPLNRQLAVANAFEDLLHTRWPRFGRLARGVYDRVGLPVSRYITRPWMADAVFVAMKPFEWAFYAALLLLDRGDPEARIDRMFRGATLRRAPTKGSRVASGYERSNAALSRVVGTQGRRP